MTRISSRFTNRRWTCTDWSTQDLSWPHEVWQWWKKNTCWAHSAIALECCVKDTMCFRSEYQKNYPLPEWRYTAQGARTSTSQDKSNLTLMEPTSAPVSPTFSWSSSRNFYQRVQLNLCQRYTASRFSGWEAPSMSSSLTIRVNLWTRTKLERCSNEEWPTPLARSWSDLVPLQALKLSNQTTICRIRAPTCLTRWARIKFPRHTTLKRTWWWAARTTSKPKRKWPQTTTKWMVTEAPRNDPNHRKKTEKYPLHLICNLENLNKKLIKQNLNSSIIFWVLISPI